MPAQFRKEVWTKLGNTWPRNSGELRSQVIAGLHLAGMLPETASIASTWTKRLEYGYPVPYVRRNMHVHTADTALRNLGIWSRGRFGSWKYEVGNQDHSCMLGVDAVDNMLFGGNAAGREATFNSPDAVNSGLRKYDRDFEPAELSRAAGRTHTFGKPPRRMLKKPQWDWVLPHCDEADEWLDQIRKVMIGLPTETKWLIHGYERCGVAEIKRPMKEMLREGLNHHDRIPHLTNLPGISSWIQHIIMHYKKLPEKIFFTPATVSESSKVFRPSALIETIGSSEGFAVWGSQVMEMPSALRDAFCTRLWPFATRARKRSCPERVVTMADAVVMLSRERIQKLSLQSWKQLFNLVSTADATGLENEQLLVFGWHLLLGQPAVLPHRASSRH